jgi:hypothetical protein
MLRLWWEFTRPNIRPDAVGARPSRALPATLAIAVAALVLSTFATVDFGFIAAGGSAGPAYVILRLLERGVGALIIVAGLFVTVARSLEDGNQDDRPAPWVLYGLIAGLGVFLLHNLVDFSMFEVGPMFLMALLGGAMLGMRGDDDTADKPKQPGLANPRVIALAAACVIWLTAAGAMAIPVAIAEGHAADGDEFVRTSDLGRAAQAYHDAAAAVPYNAEYAAREARALRIGGAPADRVRQALDAAIRANPADASYRSQLAAFEASLPNPDPARVRAGYDAALALDPANVPARLDYAKTLHEALHLPAEAKAQYQKALWFNDQLQPDEVERLSPEKVNQIRATIARLEAGG